VNLFRTLISSFSLSTIQLKWSWVKTLRHDLTLWTLHSNLTLSRRNCLTLSRNKSHWSSLDHTSRLRKLFAIRKLKSKTRNKKSWDFWFQISTSWDTRSLNRISKTNNNWNNCKKTVSMIMMTRRNFSLKTDYWTTESRNLVANYTKSCMKCLKSVTCTNSQLWTTWHYSDQSCETSKKLMTSKTSTPLTKRLIHWTKKSDTVSNAGPRLV